MKITNSVFTCIFLLVTFFSWSQTSFKGQVLDASSRAPISKTEILDARYHLITHTDEQGFFTIEIDEEQVYQFFVSKREYIDYHYVSEKTQQNGETEIIYLQPEDNNLEEITISVGNRSKNRTILNTSVPVAVLTSEEIKHSGYTSTAEVIQMIVPSFSHDRIVRGDGSETIRPSSMRGMGTDQMLVLVNGKRRHMSAFLIGDNTGVDINAIPVTAIKTIEVLKDGAAAMYGSDAIAGVINIILYDDIDGTAELQTGITTRGDGEYAKLGVRKGITFNEDTRLNIAIQASANAKTVRAGKDMRKQYFGTQFDKDGNVIYSDPEGDIKNDEYLKNPRITMIEGDPDKKNLSTFLNFDHKLDEASALYAFGGYNYGNTLNGSNRFRLPSDDGNVREIYPDGYLARGRFVTHDLSLTSGYKSFHKLLGKYDLSVSLGNSLVDIGLENSINPSMGTESPTDFHLGKQNLFNSNVNLDFSKSLDTLENHILSYGAEVRYESYKLTEGEEASYKDGGVPIIDGPNSGNRAPVGSQGYVGYRPENSVDESRNIGAAYIDYSGDITSNFNIGIAGRYEYYSDFGSTVNGKIAARYEFTPGYAVRGAFNTGFRAPSLQQTYFSQTQTNFRYDPEIDQIVSRENSTLSLESQAAKALGATALKPEKSYNFSAGFTLQPTKNLFFTLDYYMVRVNDRIVRTSFFTVDNPLIKELFNQYNIKGIQSARYFANAIDTRTQGFDLVGQYNLNTETAGDFTFLFSYNFNLHEVIDFNNPQNLEDLNETVFDEERQAAFSKNQSNLNLMIVHKYRKWRNTLRMFHAGKVSNSYPVKEEVIGLNTMPAINIFDAEVSYAVTPSFQISLGGTNLLDKMPPEADEKLNFYGNFKYYNGNGSQLGTAGASYYLKLGYSF